MNESLKNQIIEFCNNFFHNVESVFIPKIEYNNGYLTIEYGENQQFRTGKSIDNFLSEFEKVYNFKLVEYKKQDYECKGLWFFRKTTNKHNRYFYVKLINIKNKKNEQVNKIITNVNELKKKVRFINNQSGVYNSPVRNTRLYDKNKEKLFKSEPFKNKNGQIDTYTYERQGTFLSGTDFKQLHNRLPIYPSFLINDIKPFTYLVKVINKDILEDGNAVLYKTTENYYRLVQLSNEFHNSEFKERHDFYTFIDRESYNENDYQYVDNLESVISDGDILQNKSNEIILVQFIETPDKENVTFPYIDNGDKYNLIIIERTGNTFSIGKFYQNSETTKPVENFDIEYPQMIVDKEGTTKPITEYKYLFDRNKKFYYTFIYAKDYDTNKYKLVRNLS